MVEISRECVSFFYSWFTNFPLMLILSGLAAVALFSIAVWVSEKVWPEPVVSRLERQETDEYKTYARPLSSPVRIEKRTKTEVQTPAFEPALTA